MQIRLRGGWISWLTMAIGLMVFMCGAVLLGLAQYAGRVELWDLGWPLALGGQSALLVGLLLRVEALWNAYRQTIVVLKALEGDVVPAQPPMAPPRALHVHYVEQANPQRVLADLRGQLDLLAMSLTQNQNF